MSFINILLQGKIEMLAFVDPSPFNIISKKLFNKIKTNHSIGPVTNDIRKLYKDAIGEINGLEIQFLINKKYVNFEEMKELNFIICEKPLCDLILGQVWLENYVKEIPQLIKDMSQESSDPYLTDSEEEENLCRKCGLDHVISEKVQNSEHVITLLKNITKDT
ncbi:hypothetical protein C1645_785343 [Glomus cerebriforme]|uniref:Uncharacterized protein n=1 Tax=Glomus cerebriforme TaxID=658196 RepID=A0A397SC32_9GLOM|nr:hypothetical protein C1645_785343 [Glomus cerebriforme]